MNKHVKSVLIGVAYGGAIIVLHKLLAWGGLYREAWQMWLVAAAYFVLAMAFLLSGDAIHVLIRAGLGIGVSLFLEILILVIFSATSTAAFSMYNYTNTLPIYFFGFTSSFLAFILAVILGAFGIGGNIWPKISTKGETMENKNKFLAYLGITFLSFAYLVMPSNSGIGMPIFALLQIAMLPFVVENKRALFWLIPILAIFTNPFISANPMWKISNVFAFVILLALMFSKVSLTARTSAFFKNLFANMAVPFKFFALPFKTIISQNENRGKIIGRVLLGLLIAVPSVALLTTLLCMADSVFRENVLTLLDNLYQLINLTTVLKVLISGGCALYIFGAVYNANRKTEPAGQPAPKTRNGDLIILNILLISVVTIYALFAVIQFRYLFARGALPGGLEYFEYARRGFFELLTLTAINIVIILVAVKLTAAKYDQLWGKIAKYLSFALGLLTIVMLVSSFYRMWLYSDADGLTRLRLLVFCFLAFELLGLLATLVYVIKPKFNMVVGYFIIMVAYYAFVNLLPLDHFVAKSQVDRYLLNGDPGGIEYTLTLSADALPQVERLVGSEYNYYARVFIRDLQREQRNTYPRWQRYNLSTARVPEFESVLEYAPKVDS